MLVNAFGSLRPLTKVELYRPSSVLVHKLDQIHLLPGAVLGGFEQIDDAGETGAAGEFGCDVMNGDLAHARDANEATFHHITSAGFRLRALSNADGAADLAARDRRAQPLQEAEAHE